MLVVKTFAFHVHEVKRVVQKMTSNTKVMYMDCCFQVSHHPPMFSEYCEGKDWTFWQEYTVSSKFRGKYLTVYPIGACHLVFHKTKSHYTWCKAVTTVHNIIVGKLWIDQVGISGSYCRFQS